MLSYASTEAGAAKRRGKRLFSSCQGEYNESRITLKNKNIVS